MKSESDGAWVVAGFELFQEEDDPRDEELIPARLGMGERWSMASRIWSRRVKTAQIIRCR
jgi:hypothetical protein